MHIELTQEMRCQPDCVYCTVDELVRIMVQSVAKELDDEIMDCLGNLGCA